MDVKTEARRQYDYMVSMRRHFHRHPEPSGMEVETAARISEELTAEGIENIILSNNAVIGRIYGKTSGGTVALRADIDALQMRELNDCEYRSEREGVMHSCGHDVHTAALLGAAKALSRNTGAFSGEARLLFQPAEELCLGAKEIVRQGYLKDVDAVFGMHVTVDQPAGALGCTPGIRTAAADSFSIDITARAPKAGAGSQAVSAAPAVLMALQTIASREVNPKDTFVFSCCGIHGGRGENGDSVSLLGTCRYLNPEYLHTLQAKVERIVCGLAANYGCAATVNIDHLTYPIENNKECCDIARQAIVKLFGEQSYRDTPAGSVSEDFSFYLREVKGCFGFLGANSADMRYKYPNHNPRFELDEESLYYGASLFIQYALDFLNPR